MQDAFHNRIKLTLAAVQCALILGGTLVAGMFQKVATSLAIDPESNNYYHLLQFVRYDGICFLIIPALWTALAIGMERSGSWWTTTRATFLSGLAIALGLAAFYIFCVVAALCFAG